MTMDNNVKLDTRGVLQNAIPDTKISEDYVYDILQRLVPGADVENVKKKFIIKKTNKGFFSTVIVIELTQNLTIGEHNLDVGTHLALKIPNDSEHKGTFIHEYKMLRLASVTGFTPYPLGQDEQSRAILMFYKEGKALLSNEDYDYKTLRNMIYQIAKAVDTLFTNGIIHCDPSMGNILQTESGVLILDFGASVSITDFDPHFLEISSNIRPFGVTTGQVIPLLGLIFDSEYYNSKFRMALTTNNASFFNRYKAFMTLVWALHLFNVMLGTKGTESLENFSIPLISYNGITCTVNSNASKFIAKRFNLSETNVKAWLQNIADFANEIVNLESSSWSFTVQSILSGLFFVEG